MWVTRITYLVTPCMSLLFMMHGGTHVLKRRTHGVENLYTSIWSSLIHMTYSYFRSFTHQVGGYETELTGQPLCADDGTACVGLRRHPSLSWTGSSLNQEETFSKQ